MTSASVLDHLSIGYSPVFDPHRQLCGLRLSVATASAGAERLDADALWEALSPVLASAPVRPQGPPPLWVNLNSESLLEGVMRAAQRRPQPLLIEVPGFLVMAHEPLIRALVSAGQALCVAGSPGAESPAVRALGFAWSCGPAQAVAGTVRSSKGLPWLVEGARTAAEMEAAFRHGATAVAGWPMDDELQVRSPARVPPELSSALELMKRVDREESVERLEAVLTADPTLAYRLLRYLNASAFGLRAEVGSFRHGLLMLGYRRLKRWLALLLISGSQDPQSRMLMAVAARRGLILDELAGGIGDETMRGELFICGVFSLLDRMLHVPLDELMRSVPMPQRVQTSLLERGPFSPQLDLLRALEGGSAVDIRACAEAALVGCGELNRALLKGLEKSWELD